MRSKMQRMCISDRAVSNSDAINAADIRAVFPNHTMKRLARALRAPVDTARALLYRRIPSSRRREIALVLDEQIDEQIAYLAGVKAKVQRVLEDIERESQAIRRQETNNQSETPGNEGRQIDEARRVANGNSYSAPSGIS